MKIIITGLICFGIWAAGTTYWYLCKIEHLCPGETSNKNVAANIETKDITAPPQIIKEEPVKEEIVETPPAEEEETPESNETEVLDESKGITKNMLFYFDFSKSNIKENLSKNESFQNLITFLKENTDKNIVVIGHTDNVGKAENNLALGKKRANAVKEILTSENIDASRIEVKSLGETQPLEDNESETGRQKNRRVEILIND
ncbi:MAG: OmpA family protein [Bacteroidota bacterium]